MKKTLYELLGIEPDANSDQIRFAYKRRASETHPDKGGEKGEFEAVKFAYDVLIDPERRAEYDAFETAEAEKIDPIVNMYATLFMGAVMRVQKNEEHFFGDRLDTNVVSLMGTMLRDEQDSTNRDMAELQKGIKRTRKLLKGLSGSGKVYELSKQILTDKVRRNQEALAERIRHLKELEELSAFIKDLSYSEANAEEVSETNLLEENPL